MKILPIVTLLSLIFSLRMNAQTEIWSRHELSFSSEQTYQNPLYDLKEFYVVFESPTGRQIKINGFWDGGKNFKVRFAPDETGTWSWSSHCSGEDSGLQQHKGSFECIPSTSKLAIYQKGAIKRSTGDYHLSYADGTPFFFVGCTAWNGALKSTEEEWDTYLKHRVDHNYSVIQFVTTQWRGCEKDQKGEVAFTGSGYIELNTQFFQRLDKKIDKINEYGLVAAPVLLWALPVGEGRHLSPGYYLPQNEAILLGKYMVARFGGNHVIWFLGGDGRYTKEYEQRWKNIGRGVFEDDPPGIVAQHPQGSQWIGEEYKDEDWLDIIGYQSSHNKRQGVIDWINKGPMANTWDKLPARPIINLEPNYEEIFFAFTDEDVRNASYWSIFATPMGGITYGANGIWPWIQKEGELIENHRNTDGKGPSTWRKSIDFPGSHQIGYLSAFIQQYPWWKLKPALPLLGHQPGDSTFNHFISMVATDDLNLVMAYTPRQNPVVFRNIRKKNYQAKWFDPVKNTYINAKSRNEGGLMTYEVPGTQDYVLVLEAN